MAEFIVFCVVKSEDGFLKCIESLKPLANKFFFLGINREVEKFLTHNNGRAFLDSTLFFEKSIDYAKQYINIEKSYGILVDSEMIFKNTSLNIANLEKDCYNLLRIYNDLESNQIHLIKLSKVWRYENDQWICDEPVTNANLGKNVAYIEETKDLYKDPNMYSEYIKNGKNSDLLFYSHLKLGDFSDTESKKIYHYLEACNKNPERSEGFYKLSRHYRNCGKYFLASQFILLGKNIQKPQRQYLFLDDKVYSYGFDEEMSIVGYYVDKYVDDGFSSCTKIMLSRKIDKSVQDLAFENQYHYIKPYPWKNKINIKLYEDDQFKCTSSSFINMGTFFLGIQRYVNYSIVREHGGYIIRDPQNHIITKNALYVKTGNHLNVLGFLHTKVPKRRESHIKGLEDMRIFIYRNEIYAFATTFEWGLYEKPNQVLCKLNGLEITRIVPLNYKQEYQQKNWCPFVWNDKICCVYSYEPLRILEIDEFTGECKEIMNKYCEYNLVKFRGNTSPVFYNNEYIVIVHEYYTKGSRHYFHRIIRFDENWNIKHVSLPFYIENKQIEYVLGFDRIKDNTYLLHYSTMDNTSNFVEIEI